MSQRMPIPRRTPGDSLDRLMANTAASGSRASTPDAAACQATGISLPSDHTVHATSTTSPIPRMCAA